MYPQLGDVRLLAQIVEHAICVPWFDEAAVGGREDQPRLAPSRAGREPLLELSFAVHSQDAHQRGWYWQHRDRRLRFHRLKSQLTVDPMQRLADCQPTPVQIDIAPRDPERFASPQSHRQRDCPQRVEPVLLSGFEEANRFSAGEASNLSVIRHPQLNERATFRVSSSSSTASCSAARSTLRM